MERRMVIMETVGRLTAGDGLTIVKEPWSDR
jgi:hypothetical protein